MKCQGKGYQDKARTWGKLCTRNVGERERVEVCCLSDGERVFWRGCELHEIYGGSIFHALRTASFHQRQVGQLGTSWYIPDAPRTFSAWLLQATNQRARLPRARATFDDYSSVPGQRANNSVGSIGGYLGQRGHFKFRVQRKLQVLTPAPLHVTLRGLGSSRRL